MFLNANDNNKAALRIMATIIFVMMGLLFYQMQIASTAMDHIKIDIPPDLSKGATIRPGQKQHTSIYDFTSRFMQQLQHWRYDGSKEYEENIDTYSDYFTPAYKAFLHRDYERRAKDGELSGRTRTLYPLLSAWDDDRVKVLSKSGGLENSWVVLLDMELVETYKGEEIKRKYLRYPIRIVRYDVDIKTNPWGLAIDGYAEEPKVLTKEDM